MPRLADRSFVQHATAQFAQPGHGQVEVGHSQPGLVGPPAFPVTDEPVDRRKPTAPVDLIEQALAQLRSGGERPPLSNPSLHPGVDAQPGLDVRPDANATPRPGDLTVASGTAPLGAASPQQLEPEITEGVFASASAAVEAAPLAPTPAAPPPVAPATASAPSIVTPGPAPAPNLDGVVAHMRLVLVSRRHQHELPDHAVGRPFVEGLASILTVASPDDEPRFVVTDELHRWGLTPEMAYDLASRQTRTQLDDIVKRIPTGSTTALVAESDLPLAASGLLFMDELLRGPIPDGTLVAMASPRVMLVLPAAVGDRELVEAAVDFLRHEADPEPQMLTPTLLARRHQTWEVAGDLTSAAGRFGLRQLVKTGDPAPSDLAAAPEPSIW